jgi:hypothetical protein
MKIKLIAQITLIGISVEMKSQPVIFQSEKLQKVWEVDGLSVPESVLPVPGEGLIYVSNIGSNDPTAKDHTGFISVLNADGTVNTLKWASGLNSPKGMAILNDKLFVTEVDKISEIDVSTGKVLKSYPVDNAGFLNDIAADKSGNLYISDSRTGSVFKLSGGKVKLFIKSAEYSNPNGLFVDGSNLLLGTGDKIISINTSTGEAEDYMLNTGGVDGLQLIASGAVVYSNWSGTIFTLQKGSEKELLLDTSTSETIKSADFGYNASVNLIYVPTFFGNSVVCYKLTFE